MPRLSYLQRIARQFSKDAPVLLPLRPLFRPGEADASPPLAGDRLSAETHSEPAVPQPRHEPDREFAQVADSRTATLMDGVSYGSPDKTAAPGRQPEGSAPALPRLNLPLSSGPPAEPGPTVPPFRQDVIGQPKVDIFSSQSLPPSPGTATEPGTASSVPSARGGATVEPPPEERQPPVPSRELNRPLQPPRRDAAQGHSPVEAGAFPLTSSMPINPAIEPPPEGQRSLVRITELNKPRQPPRRDAAQEPSRRVTLEPRAPAVTARAPSLPSPPLAIPKSETSTGATVQIGSIEVHITPAASSPPPAAPSPSPLARPAPPAVPLARGFTSPFGLRQG